MPNAIRTVPDTETHFSTSSLAKALPPWIDGSHLDGSAHGYGLPIPAGQGSDIRAAAALHHAALAGCGREEAHRVLMGLRSATILQANDEAEAKATLALLRSHLADVPLDILETACRAYCNQPGPRFFPRSAGELRAFTGPLVAARQARARALLRLAEQADAEDAERKRLADDPLTPEMIAAIKAEYGLGRAGASAPVRATADATRPARSPAIADYVALGLTIDEATQAVADHARMMARGRPAAPIADAVDLGPPAVEVARAA